jgi:hypothetical protein
MNGRRIAAVLVRASGVVVTAGLGLLLAPAAASACDVSYDYKPSLDFKHLSLGGGQVCSNGTSLAGAVIVALLAVSALTAAGVFAFRRGEATAKSMSAPDDAARVEATLVRYLTAAGLEGTRGAAREGAGTDGREASP